MQSARETGLQIKEDLKTMTEKEQEDHLDTLITTLLFEEENSNLESIFRHVIWANELD